MRRVNESEKLVLNGNFTKRSSLFSQFKSIEFTNEDTSKMFLTYLTNYFDVMQTTIVQVSDSFQQSLEFYYDMMDRNIDKVRNHLPDNDFDNDRVKALDIAFINLQKIHVKARTRSMEQVCHSFFVHFSKSNRNYFPKKLRLFLI